MKKHYLVYKTTNLVNGKIYIGQHQTYDINDDYLGSGILIQRAIEKYGEENFKREILFECSSIEEMNAKEAELVNEEFLKRDDVYNLKLGGDGGFDYINAHGLWGDTSKGGQAFLKRLNEDPEFRKEISNKIRQLRKDHPEKWEHNRRNGNWWLGKHLSDETKRKISEKNKLRLCGRNNGSFGTVWIFNETLMKNQKVKKEHLNDWLSQGWKLGRRFNFNAPID